MKNACKTWGLACLATLGSALHGCAPSLSHHHAPKDKQHLTFTQSALFPTALKLGLSPLSRSVSDQMQQDLLRHSCVAEPVTIDWHWDLADGADSVHADAHMQREGLVITVRKGTERVRIDWINDGSPDDHITSIHTQSDKSLGDSVSATMATHYTLGLIEPGVYHVQREDLTIARGDRVLATGHRTHDGHGHTEFYAELHSADAENGGYRISRFAHTSVANSAFPVRSAGGSFDYFTQQADETLRPYDSKHIFKRFLARLTGP